jgi:hypothetical protein
LEGNAKRGLKMTCPELLNSRLHPVRIDYGRYFDLHPHVHHLINGWFRRAWENRDCHGAECFEAFIYAWFAFNGWAVCVTDLDEDYKYIDALKRDPTLCQKFSDLAALPDSPFGQSAAQFAELWPIFDVKSLRRLHIPPLYTRIRSSVIEHYLAAGATNFEPKCWKRHKDAGESIPVDWPHTLAALYKVRCNLFHGQKSADSETDQQIVSLAFRTLTYFYNEVLHIRDY